MHEPLTFDFIKHLISSPPWKVSAVYYSQWLNGNAKCQKCNERYQRCTGSYAKNCRFVALESGLAAVFDMTSVMFNVKRIIFQFCQLLIWIDC